MKKHFKILAIFLFSFTFSEDFESTRFEKIWKKTFRRMNFRNPVSYFPYDIKIGYYAFGDSDYWKKWSQIFQGEQDFGSDPFVAGNPDFPSISNHVYRRGLSFELDLFKVNFFSSSQNIIDVLLGLGYKYNKSIKGANFRDLELKPFFHNINLNATFIYQWDSKFYSYLYYSGGPTRASFYSDSSGEATGQGFDHGIGFGINFVTPSKKRNNNLNYGIELKFEKCKIDDIAEPNGNNYINSFDMSKVGILFSFGIGYGGEATLGDKAYLNILDKNYLLALEQLNQFQYQNEYSYKKEEINDMMVLCRQEISNQLYQDAMDAYYKGNLDKSLKLLKESSYKANSELKFEIENKKYFIANEMLTSPNENLKNYSIDQQIIFFESLKDISERIKEDVNEKIASLYIKKAEIALNKKDYKSAYELYQLSSEKDKLHFHIINIKLENMVVLMLNDIYKFLQNKDYVIAYELLSLISDISEKNIISSSLKDIVDSNLENKKIKSIRDRVHKILDNERELLVSSKSKNIYLGDQYEDVIEILGVPEYKIDRKKLDYEYEMLVFNIDDITYRLFFKNKILIDVEREL